MSRQSLEQMVQAFAIWRQNKPKYSLTPIELRQQAVNLLDNFTAGAIVKALGLGGVQFKKWCQQLSNAEPQNNFVALPITPPNIDIPKLELELTFTNNCQLRIRGELSADLLRALLQEAKA